MPSATPAPNGQHEAINPIHPSMLDRLDPTFIDLYNKHVANSPNQAIDLAFLRTKYSVLYSYGTGPAPDVGRIYDSTIPVEGGEVDVRVYEPSSSGPWPVHIDFHGGGWGLGDLDTEAHICKHICHKANVAVIDVAYRLVPEHVFPTGIEDSFAAIKYIYEHPEVFNVTKSLSVGGVSAGGNIALVCAHWARDANIPLQLVAAGTPTIDDLAKYSSASESPFPSMQENEFAPTLNWARLAFFDRLKWGSLSTDPAIEAQQRKRIGWVKNLLDAPNFKDLPRTLIYTAGADPLRDEGEAYGRKLVENGAEVVFKRFPGVPHPFMHMDGALWQASQFIDMTCKEIRFAHEDR
ncbi:hypothetical protein A1O1_04689 [Capronia coronata CBS 617.96]|uniref:Alpha/beta hydrolase fold-3 domain-containing protein n=1 Tax=Capronia coronata CBS 617.96 TaxID=1182541 RepID=W9Y4K9_9EURO|nr:uncharacterized protein A1O1_04689 [Capronia coronata CBS 617.96]EXJ87762.1 hypothetical protein A1O1_04689 [Capronia coronata CBS 617.96]